MPPSSPALAETRERQQLFSPVALVGLIALVAAALVLVFPGGNLLEQIYRYPRHDELSSTYIDSILKTDPGNRRLRLTLVERQLAGGDLQGARRALAPLRTESGEDRQVRLLEYRLLRMEADLARNPADAANLRERVRGGLTSLASLEWEPAQLVQMAEEARALGIPRVAVGLYERLDVLEPEHGQAGGGGWSERGANAALEAGDYRAAAEAYLAARRRASTPAAARDYFLKAVKTLQSGNRLAEALALADANLGDLADDDTVLLYLVGLARAANDPARAQAYAKKLMRMGRSGWGIELYVTVLRRHPHLAPAPSSPSPLMGEGRGGGGRSGFAISRTAMAAILDTLIGAAHAAAPEAPGSRVPAGMRPFDDEKYTLAYEVFLGARNLEDAYRVAFSAVTQAPDHPAWRLRLAQVAEWTGRGGVALEQWRYLAARAAAAREREQAWQSVLRLAPALQDDEALLAAWLHAAETQPMNAERWTQIAAGFERVARAADGAAYFQRRYEKSGDEAFLDLQAFLLERIGRDDEAIGAYLRLIEKHRATAPRLLRVAVLMLHRNRFRETFEVLERHRGAVDARDTEFWDLFAELAWNLQQDEAALAAYKVLTGRAQTVETDWQRLVQLMRERDPGGAARIAALGYERHRTPVLLTLAAELYWQERDLPALRELYGHLNAEDDKRMAGNAYFITLRAQYHDADGRPREAAADYRRAIALDPGNTDFIAALLWHLVSRKEVVELRRELAAYASRAREGSALWEAYAAAYALLGDVPRALSYYARLRDAKRDDYLWLLNYADVLEQGGQLAMALRVRRHAWQIMRAELQNKGVRSVSRAELEAVARMTLAGTPGDPALRLVGRILRQDFVPNPESAPDRALDAGMRELVLSWALSTERFDAAKTWLWQQYARQLARPAWAELSIALAQNDREAVERLLAGDAEGLPVYDRIEAARTTGRLKLAQTYAFEAQEKRPDDDELHLRLTDNLLESANSLVYTDTAFERGVLKGREQRLIARIWVTERLRLTLDLGRDSRLASLSPASLVGVPGQIEEYGLGLRLRHERAYTDIRIGYRSALGSHVPLMLSHTRDWDARLSGVLRVALDERAPETIPLYLGGMRDRLSANLIYRLSLREYLTAELWTARYHTQDDTYLGRGRGLYWEVGHRFRTEYPDWRVRLTGSHNSYTADGTVDARAARLDPTGGTLGARYFVPESFDVLGAYVSFGDSYRERYSRAFRFFADIGPTWNSKLGEGFLFSVGGGLSVLGHDRLAVYYTRSKGGSAIGGFTTELGLRYEYLFDRW